MIEFIYDTLLFRSIWHLLWFLQAMLGLGYVIWVAQGRPSKAANSCTGNAWSAFIIAAMAAIIVPIRGSGPVFSYNCIWFNALMGVIYLLYRAKLRRGAQ